MLNVLTQSPWVERTGWVLIHSLWQFALVALLAVAVQWALRRRSAATRYGVLLAAMSIVVALPAATWFAIGSGEKPLAVAPARAEDETGVLPPPRSASGETPLSTAGAAQCAARGACRSRRSRPLWSKPPCSRRPRRSARWPGGRV